MGDQNYLHLRDDPDENEADDDNDDDSGRSSFWQEIGLQLLSDHEFMNSLETITIDTDGTLTVASNREDVQLWCNFTVPLRTALRVRWYNGRDIVAHYEENITDVGANYKAYINTTGDLTVDNAAIELNVTELVSRINVTRVTYKCLVHFFDGNSSQTDSKNTTVIIADKPHRPSNVTVVCDIASARLSWQSQFDGGLTQTFHLSYRHSGRTESETKEDPGEGNAGTANWTLNAAGEYTFNIFGRNSLGDSETVTTSCNVPVPSTKTTAVPVPPTEAKTGQPKKSAGAGARVSATLLIGLIVFIVITNFRSS